MIFRFLIFIKDLLSVDTYPFRTLLSVNKFKKNDTAELLIEEHQVKQLKNLIEYAQNFIPYYKKNAVNDLDYAKVVRDKTLNRYYPILTKAPIQQQNNELINLNVKKYINASTSGSSGIPLSVRLSGQVLSNRRASHIYCMSWWGVKIWDRNIEVVGSRVNAEFSKKQLLMDYLRGRYRLNIFKISTENIDFIIKRITAVRPKYIRGIKSGIYDLALVIKKNNIDVNLPDLKVVIVTAEVLYDKERKIIESVFGVPVANEFGAVEGGIFAYECPKGHIHINESSVYIEIINNNNMTVTEFDNYAMPLINYQNMDRIVISNKQCECGRKSRIIETIEGRISDVIMKENGDFLNFSLFYYLIDKIDSCGSIISQYHVEQKDLNFKFYIVKSTKWDDTYLGVIEKEMKKAIGENISIEFIFVDKLPREKSGKLRDFVRIK